MNVEQAIFTSEKTECAAGYRVVAHSEGICPADHRELSVWCPSHDSLVEQSVEAMSLNFHPLPSGAYCVSKTVPAGWEYSGRGGMRVYTHCLIVRPELLDRFGNNPFALLQAAKKAGILEIRDPIPRRLESLPMPGGAAAVDELLLTCLANRPGPEALGFLVQAALDSICLAVAGETPPCELFAGLFSCLPMSCRLEFSFSTSLKFTLRRPFHLISATKDPSQQRWLAHQSNLTLLDLSAGKPLPKIPIDGWARFVQQALILGRTPFLAAQLSKRRSDLKPGDLPALGLQLLEEMESSAFADSRRIGAGAMSQKDIQSAHAAHRQFQKSVIPAEIQIPHAGVETPSAGLETDSPEMREKFELLDDLVYDAIGGRPGSLEKLQVLWPAMREELDDQMLAESREQYLRFALSIWEKCVDSGDVRDPVKAVQALDVLCLLFEQ